MSEKRKLCVSIPIKNGDNLNIDLQKVIDEIESALEKGADLIECRFDFMTKFQELDSFLDEISKYKANCIYTLRPIVQGGNFRNDHDERIPVLKRLIDQGPQFVDVEYEIVSMREELADYIEASNTKILVSWHDFKLTPNHVELIDLVNKMRIYSPYLKIVTMANSFNDVIEIFELYQSIDTNINLVSFAMGESGIITRLLCPIIGESPFTYASLSTPIAPGQLSINQIVKFNHFLKKKMI